MTEVETHEYPPVICERFERWEDATGFLRKAVDQCVDEGYWFREVELSHYHDFDSKSDVIQVYIRRFPKIVAERKADKIILDSLCGFHQTPPASFAELKAKANG